MMKDTPEERGSKTVPQVTGIPGFHELHQQLQEDIKSLPGEKYQDQTNIMKNVIKQKMDHDLTLDTKDIGNLLSECNRGNSHFTSSYVNTPDQYKNTKPRGFDETKKLVDNFREKTANYPRHFSHEGSTVICVLLSMTSVATISFDNLPSIDQELINELLRPFNAFKVLSTPFKITFDEHKDFSATFQGKGGHPDIKLGFINSVIHPLQEYSKDFCQGTVPIEKDGDKIAVGKIVLDKKNIQRLTGINPSEKDESEVPVKRQPVAGRNAFELRTDIMQMALDYGIHNRITSDEIVSVAKKFYQFVENRR
jgi:hypothetical protein